MANTKAKLLIIDDDLTLLQGLEVGLTGAGYTVMTASDGLKGLQTFYNAQPDLVILDLMMPKMDGWQVCRRIRELWDVPIIMLTARAQMVDRVTGLKLGADDYVTKPFDLKELEARVEAVLRRAKPRSTGQSTVLFSDDRLVIDSTRQEVLLDGRPLDLTAIEMRLIIYLAENVGCVVTAEQIRSAVWGPQYTDELSSVKFYIWRLRRKIERSPSEPEYIMTERGLGYRFVRPN